MELSPEEYGAYWRASVRIAAGVLVVFFGHAIARPLFSHPDVGATGLGVFLVTGIVLAGSFLVVLGLARVIRTAVDAEMRG